MCRRCRNKKHTYLYLACFGSGCTDINVNRLRTRDPNILSYLLDSIVVSIPACHAGQTGVQFPVGEDVIFFCFIVKTQTNTKTLASDPLIATMQNTAGVELIAQILEKMRNAYVQPSTTCPQSWSQTLHTRHQ